MNSYYVLGFRVFSFSLYPTSIIGLSIDSYSLTNFKQARSFFWSYVISKIIRTSTEMYLIISVRFPAKKMSIVTVQVGRTDCLLAIGCELDKGVRILTLDSRIIILISPKPLHV